MGIAPGIDREVFEKASRALLEEMVGPAVGAAAAATASVQLVPRAPARRGEPCSTAIGADLLVVGSRAGAA